MLFATKRILDLAKNFSEWTVIEWERRLEFEEERRKYHRFEPYVNYLAAPQPTPKKRTTMMGLAPADFIKALFWMVGSFTLIGRLHVK